MDRKTLTIDKKTFEKLFLMKTELEKKEKRPISWDEFFELTLISRR
ncbi:MAG: hypothetical protein LM587_01605 [Candidatus Aenigmarchaeota archaeon]|nr:hypothetical protein [Candidatus Aenigmarchaeota archaeon]